MKPGAVTRPLAASYRAILLNDPPFAGNWSHEVSPYSSTTPPRPKTKSFSRVSVNVECPPVVLSVSVMVHVHVVLPQALATTLPLIASPAVTGTTGPCSHTLVLASQSHAAMAQKFPE